MIQEFNPNQGFPLSDDERFLYSRQPGALPEV